MVSLKASVTVRVGCVLILMRAACAASRPTSVCFYRLCKLKKEMVGDDSMLQIESFEMRLAIVVLFSYLLGSIPTAYLIAKVNHYNIFEIGSGNMGATNVSRILGIKWGLVVWFLDSVKGVSAIMLARVVLVDQALATTISALFAVIGHNWSIIVQILIGSLRGGKGAATAFGTLLMIAPAQVIIIVFAISGAIVARTRYMSLGVLVMFSLSIGWIFVLIAQRQMDPVFIVYGVLLMALLLYRFRDNIRRIFDGTERRLGEGVKST